MLRLLVFLAALGLSAAAFAQYKWVDKDGRVGFGDNPPRDARTVQRLDVRGGGSDASADLPYELRRAAQRFPVTLYSAASCPPCDLARTFLRSRGIPFAERTVSSASDGEELKRLSGGIRLPVMTVGRQVHVPFDPDAWSATLDAAGYPRGSMLPRSYKYAPAQPLTARAPEPAQETTAAAPAAGK
jgi:glutaredoxin